MRVAKEVLHCTAQEAKTRMSVVEAQRWMAYLALEAEEHDKQLAEARNQAGRR